MRTSRLLRARFGTRARTHARSLGCHGRCYHGILFAGSAGEGLSIARAALSGGCPPRCNPSPLSAVAAVVQTWFACARSPLTRMQRRERGGACAAGHDPCLAMRQARDGACGGLGSTTRDPSRANATACLREAAPDAATVSPWHTLRRQAGEGRRVGARAKNVMACYCARARRRRGGQGPS